MTAEEFSERLASRLNMFNALSARESAVISQAKNAVTRDFIIQVVTQEWAQNKQLFVRKEQVDNEVALVRKQYPDDISFRKVLVSAGITYDKWEERLKYTLLERMVLDEIKKNIKKPSPEELKAYYQNNKQHYSVPAGVRLRQIVLDTDENAQRIKKELASGKQLKDLAKKFSITDEASLGGDLGWIEKGYLDIFDAAFRMTVGQRSQIVKSPFGYHIFEVTAKRSLKNQSLEEVRSKIENALIAEREQASYSSWLEEQTLKSHIFKDDEFLKQIRVQTRGHK